MLKPRRGLIPGAAPARVLKFVRRNPKARPTEISVVLGIKRSTVEMAICRLVQMKLYRRPARVPRELKPKESSPSPTESMRIARGQFTAAAAIGPSLRATSAPCIHPTGSDPFHVLAIASATAAPVEAIRSGAGYTPFRSGAGHTPAAGHVWGYLSNHRPKPGG